MERCDYKNLKDTEVSKEEWYNDALRSRAGWSALYRDGLECCRERKVVRALLADQHVICKVCSRTFRRQNNKQGDKGSSVWMKDRSLHVRERERERESSSSKVQSSVSIVSDGSRIKEV